MGPSLDPVEITKVVLPFVEQATCLDCCKLYIAPETASCGHTSCHACWRKRRSCICCAAPLDRRILKLNTNIQIITEHVHTVCELFEKIFNYKVDTFSIGDGMSALLDSEPDPTKNVNYWLSSSQNHFSAPISSDSTQDITTVEHLTSTVQVHSHTKKIFSPKKVVLKQAVQDDWEKIEELPETRESIVQQKKIVGDNYEYSSDNPRRSLRKRELKHDEYVPNILDASKDKSSSKNSSTESETKTIKTATGTIKTKQKWNNVKKMRKEFSKLNKQNRNKLNVSIEMCKKSKANTAKPSNTNDITTIDPISAQLPIKDTLCDNSKISTQTLKEQKQNIAIIDNSVNKIKDVSENSCKELQLNSSKRNTNKINLDENVIKSKTNCIDIQGEKENDTSRCYNNGCDISNVNLEKTSKMPFYKNGTLHIETDREIKNNIKTVNYNIDCSNSHNADDIEITIKIGDTVANICFKRKNNDPPKVNINQEIQTSIGIHTLDDISHLNVENLQKNIEASTENEQSLAAAKVNNISLSTNRIAPVEAGKLNRSICTKNNTASSETDKTVLVDQGLVNASMSKNKAISAGTLKTSSVKQGVDKSTSTKKNTASAETVTAQFDITDSVEKELSIVMEIEEQEECNQQNSEIICTKSGKLNTQVPSNIPPKNIEIENPQFEQVLDGADYSNDLDIFDSGSVQETVVHVLRNVKYTPSEILMPTMKSIKGKSQKKAEKRNRDMSEDIEMTNKKQKVQNSPKLNDVEFNKSIEKEYIQDSEGINYDAIMGQVFANIDAEIHNTQKSKTLIKDTQPSEESANHIILDQQKTIVLIPEKTAELPIDIKKPLDENAVTSERYSENIFTIVDKENESEILEDKNQNSKAFQQEDYLTADVIREEEDKLCTPHVEDDDKSVVEETPQKSVSFSKPKNKSENAQQNLSLIKQKSMHESQVLSVLDVSDSEISSKAGKEVTVVDVARKQTETPLTINKFVDQIKHKSTPVARKSLNFDNYADDPEQTLCPTTEPAKTTQEKEFMSKAFENTPISPLRKPLVVRNAKLDVKPYCLAGSCLSSMELMKLKVLCRQHNWKYVDKYTSELTHLVVGVDDENKSQRSVKYMCALAASKWIVSFRWIDVCLNTNKIVNEEYFEALDGTGEPGPKRSRIAKKKLFEGITFYCMPPFSVLDVDTLKNMLEAAGGKVVDEVKLVRAAGDSPALLLAEPENTQENKFIYMAVELSVVPVNYEWVLNCLGGYSLCSVHELLLCPATLLPAAAASWPRALISQDD